MKSALQPYFQKRDFKITSEPTGGKASEGNLLFVIQKHAATRLHYDFRLELDGVAEELGGAEGAEPRSRRQAPGRARRGPSDRLRRLRRRRSRKASTAPAR